MSSNPTFEVTARLPGAPTPNARLGGPLDALASKWVRWMHNAETRRQLERLDDRLLRDAGLDPHLARAEAMKPFWQPVTLGRIWDQPWMADLGD